LKLGGHLSVKEGLRYVVVNARAMNYDVVQIMLGGGTDYKPYSIEEKDIREFTSMMYGIDIWVHLPYVINPCEGEPRRKSFYRKSFRDYAKLALAVGAKGMVIHPGFKKQLTENEAATNLLEFFRKVVEDEDLKVLLEVDAGSKNGSAVGSVEFIALCLDALDMNNMGMCLDTTHLYARGVDLWNNKIRTGIVINYGEYVRLVHLNSPDPEVVLGNNKDRHNTPFEDRDWDHRPMILDMVTWPCILERRSLAIQEQDAAYVRSVVEKV